MFPDADSQETEAKGTDTHDGWHIYSQLHQGVSLLIWTIYLWYTVVGVLNQPIDQTFILARLIF